MDIIIETDSLRVFLILIVYGTLANNLVDTLISFEVDVIIVSLSYRFDNDKVTLASDCVEMKLSILQ